MLSDEITSKVVINRGARESQHTYKYTNFHKTVPPVYWINLDSEEGRRNAFEKHLNELGVRTHKRISAISFKSTTLEVNDVFTQRFGWDMRLGKQTMKDFAVLMSHIAAIKTAVHKAERMGSRYALILEDDISFSFDIDFKTLIDTAPKDFSILQLETCNYNIVNPLFHDFIAVMEKHIHNNSEQQPPFWHKQGYTRIAASSWGLQGYIIDTEVIQRKRAFRDALKYDRKTKVFHLEWAPFEMEEYCQQWEQREKEKLTTKNNESNCRKFKPKDDNDHPNWDTEEWDPYVCCNEVILEMQVYMNMFPPTYLSSIPMMHHGSFQSTLHVEQDLNKRNANQIMNETIFYPIKTGKYNGKLPEFLWQNISGARSSFRK